MSTTPTAPSEVSVCTCGRSYAHCRKCGKRNPYVRKLRSMDLSFELGRKVIVYACQRCSAETHTGMNCQAPSVTDEPGEQYIPFIKPKPPVDLPPWGTALAGSVEHARLLNDWVMEQNKRHSYGAVQVYIEAQKAGWHLEAFGDSLDDDVKQALVERGLWPSAGGVMADATDLKSVEETLVGSTPTPPTKEPIGLDEIIKGMQEEQK